jgi:methionyl-tRNA formyltransferase
VVVAFGRILKRNVLDTLPMVNAHFSLLPRWRGAAPVERAILAGDEVTGVCLMAIDEGLDSGPIYRCEPTSIGREETAAELRARLSALAATMLVESLGQGLGTPTPQVGEPTYADKISVSDLHLDWISPAAHLHRVVRVGRAWTTWRGRRLLVWSAQPGPAPAGLRPGQLEGDVVATGDGGLRLLKVQPEGRPPQAVADWRRGARPQPGEALGE